MNRLVVELKGRNQSRNQRWQICDLTGRIQKELITVVLYVYQPYNVPIQKGIYCYRNEYVLL